MVALDGILRVLCKTNMRLSVLLVFSALTFAQTPEPPKYTGPGSCASPSCHGSVTVKTDTSVQQNEYSTWVVKDKHAHAFAVLANPVATRMAEILRIDKADTAPKCLACHALSVLEADRARTFDSTDGVSCESCHGPASNWLGPHTTKGWTHQQSIEAGMRDERDPIHRTETCLACHLGTREKFVDHEMIAAGHPDLYFELDSFSAVMPRHWKTPRESTPGKPVEDAAWTGVRDWSVGQAVQLRAELERLTWRARNERFDKKDVWPEYSELSCFACHHALGPAKESWRQEHGYSGRRPGDPAWNASRYVVFRIVAKEIDSASAQDLDRRLSEVSEEMSKLNPDRNTVALSATAAAPLAQRFAERLAAMQYDQAFALRALQQISSDANTISLADERSAEQAAMALDSLFIAYSKDAKPSNAADVRAAINELFQLLDNPSAYDADKFAAALRRLRALLK